MYYLKLDSGQAKRVQINRNKQLAFIYWRHHFALIEASRLFAFACDPLLNLDPALHTSSRKACVSRSSILFSHTTHIIHIHIHAYYPANGNRILPSRLVYLEETSSCPACASDLVLASMICAYPMIYFVLSLLVVIFA